MKLGVSVCVQRFSLYVLNSGKYEQIYRERIRLSRTSLATFSFHFSFLLSLFFSLPSFHLFSNLCTYLIMFLLSCFLLITFPSPFFLLSYFCSSSPWFTVRPQWLQVAGPVHLSFRVSSCIRKSVMSGREALQPNRGGNGGVVSRVLSPGSQRELCERFLLLVLVFVANVCLVSPIFSSSCQTTIVFICQLCLPFRLHLLF